jgi:NADH-quinone oxidoreductase subunit F
MSESTFCDAGPSPVCFRTLGKSKPCSLSTYLELGGWQQWEKICKTKPDPKTIIETIKASGLRGRGGAGFPTGLKWSFMPPQPKQKETRYLVCNSDEGEPGTCKDREILRQNPHQLLEGMAIAAYAIGADTGYNYLRGEFYEPFEACEKALQEAIKAGYLGKGCCGSDLNMHIHNVLGAGAYIVGEETAMLESLEGKAGRPRNKPPFPIQKGLYQCPTVINNTESLASVPVILQHGSEWFHQLGTEKSGGTKLFCMNGHVARPGVFEMPLGTPFKTLLDMAGGMRQQRNCKAVIPGGSSMYVLPGETIMNCDMSYEALQEAGSAIGSGGVIVMDDHTCMVEVLANIMNFYKHESCGQCTPCREGCNWVYQAIIDILAGRGKKGDLEMICDVAKSAEGRTICVFSEAYSWPVNSFIKHFYKEFDYFIRHKKSMLGKTIDSIRVSEKVAHG